MTMLRPLLLLLTMTLALGCSSAEERAERARQALRDAIDRQDRTAAVMAVRELRESLPDTPEALLELSPLMLEAGEGAEAIWLLQDGVTRFPDDDRLKLLLAGLASTANDHETALAALEQIGPDSAEHAQAIVQLAQTKLRLGDREAALALLQEAERLYPDKPAARIARIWALMDAERRDEARVLAEEARDAAASPEERRRFDIWLAKIHAESKQVDEARSILERLVDEDPADAKPLLALLHLYLTQDQAQQALDLLEGMLEERPDDPLLHGQLSRVLGMMGEQERSEQELARYLELADSPSAYFNVTQEMARRGQQERAAELLGEGVERFPESAFLHGAYAEVLLPLERIEEARVHIEAYDRLRPEGDPTREYLRARLELAEGDVASAKARLDKLVPVLDSAQAQFWLGHALERSGDVDGAYRRYQLAFQKDAKEIAALVAMLRIARDRGEWGSVARWAPRLMQSGEPEAAETFMRSLYELRNVEGAAKVAEALVERMPDRVEAHALVARSLRMQGKLELAEKKIDETEARFGPTPALVAERALVMAFSDRLDEGIAIVEAAIAEDPEHPVLYPTLAALAFEKGDLAKGSAAVDKLGELAPEDTRGLMLRSRYLAANGKLAEARRDLLRLVELRPDDSDVHFMLGVVHADLADVDAAIASYRRSAELDRRHLGARNNLALLLAEQGDLPGALRYAQEAYRLTSGLDPRVNDTLGWLYLQQGLVDRAIALLEKARKDGPQLDAAALHLATAYRQAERPDDARRVLEEVRLRAPEGSDAHVRAGEALHSLE